MSMTMEVQMTVEEFDRLVMNFGCPECQTRVLHHPKCKLGKAWETLTEAEIQAFEIHNRFCGENGEPCQVCRLKAEREAEEGK